MSAASFPEVPPTFPLESNCLRKLNYVFLFRWEWRWCWDSQLQIWGFYFQCVLFCSICSALCSRAGWRLGCLGFIRFLFFFFLPHSPPKIDCAIYCTWQNCTRLQITSCFILCTAWRSAGKLLLRPLKLSDLTGLNLAPADVLWSASSPSSRLKWPLCSFIGSLFFFF